MRTAILALILYAAANVDATWSAERADSCRFVHQGAAAGDQIDQVVEVQLDLLVSITQGNQIVKREQRDIGRQQRRTTELLEVDAPRETTARITFHSAKQTTTGGNGEETATDQAVSGRSYLVSRRGEKLDIRTAAGKEPTPEERQLVASAAESLGRKNPLATFLNGRTVAVGETLELPDEAARELFGGWQASGALRGMQLTLRDLVDVEGAPCAAFDASLLMESTSLGASLRVTGAVILEVNTCRTRRLEMSGPISIVENRGPAGAQYTFRQDGTAHVVMQASHLRR